MPLFISIFVFSSRVSSLDARPGPSASGVEFILLREAASNVLSDLLIDLDLSTAEVKSEIFVNCFLTCGDIVFLLLILLFEVLDVRYDYLDPLDADEALLRADFIVSRGALS